MKQLMLFLMILVLSASVFGQGSPTIIPPWERRSDSAFLWLKSGDTLWVSGTSSKTTIRSTKPRIYFPDTVEFGGNLLFNGSDPDKYMIFNTSSNPESLRTFLGDGIEIVNHALTASIGTKIDDASEVKRFFLTKYMVDPTTNLIARHFFKYISSTYSGDTTLIRSDNEGSAADSELVTLGYASTHNGGLPITSSPPSDGQWQIWSASAGEFQYGSVSGGGGGGSWSVDTSYGTSGSNFLPSGIYVRSGLFAGVQRAGSSDTIVVDLLNGTSLRYKPNAGLTQYYQDSLYVVGSTPTDSFLVITNNGTETTIGARGDNISIRINKPTTIFGNLTIANSGNILASHSLQIDASNASGLGLNRINGKAVYFGLSPTDGSSAGWYIIGDTLSGMLPGLGNGSVIKNVRYMFFDNASIDSLLVARMDTLALRKAIFARSNGYTVLSSSGQIIQKLTRNEITFTTTDSAAGTHIFRGDPGLGSIDSARMVGPWYSAFKSFDSLARLSIAGASGGALVNFTRASGGSSYTVQWPNAAPSASGRYWFGVQDNVYGFWADSNSGSGGTGVTKWDTCKTCSLATGKPGSDSTFLFGQTQRIASIRQTSAGVTTFDAGQNSTARFGPTGIGVADSVMRFPTNIYFGVSVDTTIRLYKELVDSVKNAKGRFREHRLYVAADAAVYGRPKAPGSSDSVYLMQGRFMDTANGVLWTWTDSSLKGTDTDYAYQQIIFPDSMRVDSISYIGITATSAICDSISVRRRWSRAGGIVDQLVIASYRNETNTSATRQVFAVNGSTGVEVGRGEMWVVRFRNKFPSANGVVRVFGLAAQGLVR